MTHLGGNYIARSPLFINLINNKNITDGEQYVLNVLVFLCFFFFTGSWKDDQAGEADEERPKRHRCLGVFKFQARHCASSLSQGYRLGDNTTSKF